MDLFQRTLIIDINCGVPLINLEINILLVFNAKGPTVIVVAFSSFPPFLPFKICTILYPELTPLEMRLIQSHKKFKQNVNRYFQPTLHL